MPPRVVILYEDRRTDDRHFRLHDFVLANTRDVLLERGISTEMFQLVKLIDKVPKGPNNEVLRALERDAEKLHAGRTAIVAWLDDDKLYRALGFQKRQQAGTMIEAIQRRLQPTVKRDVVRIHLLRGNVEEFLQRIDSAQPGTFKAMAFANALAKDSSARDQCFKLAAEMKYAGWRKLVRAADQGFDETIQYLADHVTCEPWPPWL